MSPLRPLLVCAGAAAAVLLLARHHSHASTLISTCGCVAQADARDLPLIEKRAAHPRGTMAVLISGDGGWRAIDRQVAAGLAARGISVVGLDSPRFFASRKTPEEAACALQRIIETYTIEWKEQRVIVAGYSRGAGVAPFMVNRLPEKWRAKVVSLALISLDRTIDFYVTPASLVRRSPAADEVPVRGEIEKLHGPRVLCFYGERDDGSLCRDLAPPAALPFREPGGHHLAVNYDDLAGTITSWST